MRYGYARVSTVGQDLDDQLEKLKAEGCEVIYSEKVTGMRSDRPEFQRLLNALQDGDTLIVTKLDRFARNAEDGVQIVRALLERGVRVHILNMGVMENTSMGRLMLRMLSAIAEFDRDMIVERMAEGKAQAKQRDDYREGRPNKYSKKQLDHAMALLESNSYTEVERLTGISKATLTRYKRKVNAKA